MNGALPWWAELAVSVLLVVAGLFSLTGSIGILRMRNFFQRMHPPTLAYTLGSWCVTLASIIFFTAQAGTLDLHSWVIIIFLSITVPVTTLLLARAALFRVRQAGSTEVPPAFYSADRARQEQAGEPRT
jgi:multicomponent K+:H+ antiporter subunit G